MSNNPVDDCLSFFQAATPDPTVKNIHNQLGVHFEEVGEMISAITAVAPSTNQLLEEALEAINNLAMHLKTQDDVIRIDDELRVEFIDALADQMVTAIGSAHCLGMDISGAFNEVNESNLSKLVDGIAVRDITGKIAKGPNYRKAQLEAYA